MNRSERIDIFVEAIWEWYAHHKRSLPWRDLPDRDPTQRAYKVLVSEIMLQQTQVPRVIVAFRNFIERFPALQDLAAASDRDILIQWRGMGYNSRALRLRDAARTIMEKHGGVFPSDMDALLHIKGIGHYTAGAVRNFAFGIPTPCIDTNIRRVLHRVFIGPENADGSWEKDDRYLLELAGDVLEVAIAPERISRYSKHARCSMCGISSNEQRVNEQRLTVEWHAALMDFGSLVCTKRNPKWELCPVTAKGACLAAYRVSAPAKKERKKEPGRMVGSVFVPNRIFRGKVVEALRDAASPMTATEIGRQACIDWEAKLHRKWMDGLLEKLVADRLIVKAGRKFALPA